MTITDNSLYVRPGVSVADLDGNLVARATSVVDTTELRWFVRGQLPPDVTSWFTRAGTIGILEERWDTYRIDGRYENGVKRRFRETLELKVRQSVGDQLVLDPGLAGRLEVWRKWSPAEDPVDSSRYARWMDVHKVVVKRRFSPDGDEVHFSENARTMAGAGCDVEIAAVTVGDLEAWTFAFAAFGPTAGRTNAIVTSWRALVADIACPEQFGSVFGRSSAYPEWLVHVTTPTGSVPRPTTIATRGLCDNADGNLPAVPSELTRLRPRT